MTLWDNETLKKTKTMTFFSDRVSLNSTYTFKEDRFQRGWAVLLLAFIVLVTHQVATIEDEKEACKDKSDCSTINTIWIVDKVAKRIWFELGFS